MDALSYRTQKTVVLPGQVQIWQLQGNCPVFIVVILIYHYIGRIGDFLLPLIFHITYTTIKKYYPGESVHIHI